MRDRYLQHVALFASRTTILSFSDSVTDVSVAERLQKSCPRISSG